MSHKTQCRAPRRLWFWHSSCFLYVYIEKVNSKPFHWVPVLNVYWISFVRHTHTQTASSISQSVPHSGMRKEKDTEIYCHKLHVSLFCTHALLLSLLQHKSNCSPPPKKKEKSRKCIYWRCLRIHVSHDHESSLFRWRIVERFYSGCVMKLFG